MPKQADYIYDVKFHTCDETSKDEKQHDAVNNLLQNTIFVFQMAVSFVVPKTGPIHLVLVGLMAGRQTKAFV